MLTIRKEQFDKFRDQGMESFLDETIRHMKEFAPKHCEVIEDKGVRRVVEFGFSRAARHGFDKRGPLRFYVEMMFMFGSYFDTDFLLPWAENALKSQTHTEQLARADHLYDKMTEYLEQVSGPDDRYSLEALQKITKSQVEDYEITRDNFNRQAITALYDIHPQKCRYLGEELLDSLIERGKQLSNFYGVTTIKGTMLFIALIFAIGHGFAEDPLFPWIEATLRDEFIDDPNKRAEKLEKKTRIYLEKALQYLEEKKANV